MKNGLLYIVALIVTGLSVSAENITEENVDKTTAIMNEVWAAFGGREAIEQLETLTLESEATLFAVGQSRAPGPPWDKNTFRSISAIDLANQQLSIRNTDSTDRYNFDQAQVISTERAWQFDYRSGTATPVSEPDFNQQSGPLTRITAALLVHQLMQRAHTVRYLGRTTYKDKAHDVLSIVMEVGPAISLYIDPDTRLLSKSERVLPGFGLVEYEFDDYRKVDGIMFNHTYTFYFQGEENEIRRTTKVTVNKPVEPMLKLPKGLRKLKITDPDEPTAREIADGVFLIGGRGTYALFVEMTDHVIAVGGTGGSEQRLEMLREHVPDKPVRYGVFTHHHSDHVLAAPSYANAGASLVMHASHEQPVRAAAAEVEGLKTEPVTTNRTFRDGSRELQVLDIGPTDHTEHLLVAYLPAERILFSADHFGLPLSGRVRPANNATRDLARAIERENLDVKTLLSAHSPDSATMKHLRKALATKPKYRNSF